MSEGWWGRFASRQSSRARKAEARCAELETALARYADDLCEYPDSGGCGKFNPHICHGCYARAVTAKALNAG